MMQQHDDEPLMCETAAADFVKLSTRTLQQMRAAGRGPRWVQLSGRRIAYRRADLAAWVQTRLVEPRLGTSREPMQTRPADAGMIRR